MRALTLLFSLVAVSVALAADKASVADLLKSPKFDKKVVSVTGTVAEFAQKASKDDRPYFLFKLTDQGKFVRVFGHGKLEGVKDGQKVTVTGEFAVERKVGRSTYKNEIDASLDNKSNSVKPAK